MANVAELLRELLAVLESGAVTPFEFSGVARAQLRKLLCDGGMSWGAADKRAAEIVERIVGPLITEPAHVPQADYTESNCVVCRKSFQHPNHKMRKYLYCSAPCKRSADWQRKKSKLRMQSTMKKRKAA
jgi:hypothetical protein